MTQPSNSHRQREATDCVSSARRVGSAGLTAYACFGDGSVADRDGLHRTGIDGEIPLDLLQAAALGFRHLAPEVGQRHQGEQAEQEEGADAADGVEQRKEGDGDDEVAPQLAIVPAPGWMKSLRHQSGSSSRPSRGPGNCWASIAGFENADTTALEQALRADAAIEMVGTRTWFSGRATCLRYLAHVIGSPGDWRMAPTLANGQPAAIARYRDSAYGLGVLTVTPTGIARITVFAGGPDLAAKFGFPPVREGTARQQARGG